ncbi:Mob1/phocein [Mycena metata]|uniref:Mob1/phocein n=1 Tax=Mycena metata TaxID=1033252 RepID=A0AAD7NT52_9AGAR|nr:Mob1/phocein [Mycena metata]
MASTTTATIQRPLRGSRISSFYPVKSLPSLASLDSAFQLQEYISLLIRLDVHDVESIVAIPRGGKGKGKQRDAEGDGEGKEGGGGKVEVDEACWKYEQLRRLAQDLSHPLITMLQQVCTRTTCPEMKAGEWLYLCVAHGNDGAMEQCCAIDYILHTLDSATALLNSPRAFPSRLQIPPASHRHFTSLARRLGRIFAHAYFHHREEFEQAEAESALYARFLALTERYDLVPADFLVIPPRVNATSSNVGRGGQGMGQEGGEGEGRRGSVVPEPTLLGAALHVDTSAQHPPTASFPHPAAQASADSAAANTKEGDGIGMGRGEGASPPGLDDVVSPQRRVGRSRTDTMMLEGEAGRFPASPASAVEDSAGSRGLDAALKAAGFAEPVEAPPVIAAVATATAGAILGEEAAAAPAESTPAPTQHEHHEGQEEEEPEEDRPSHLTHAPEPPHAALEPPSPTGSELAQQQAAAEEEAALALVSPSSSTALGSVPGEGAIEIVESEGHEEREGEREGEGVGGEVEDKGQEKEKEQAPVAVPTIEVEPATPPADEERESYEDRAEEGADVSATHDEAVGSVEGDAESEEGTTEGAKEAVARAEGVVRGELAAAVVARKEEEAEVKEQADADALREKENAEGEAREEDVGAVKTEDGEKQTTPESAVTAAETKPQNAGDDEVDVTDLVGDEAGEPHVASG